MVEELRRDDLVQLMPEGRVHETPPRPHVPLPVSRDQDAVFGHDSNQEPLGLLRSVPERGSE